MANYTIAAADETLALLLVVAQSPGQGVSELARRSGNTKARAFRMLHTLEQRRFLRRDAATARYWLDAQALYVGVAAQDQVDLVRCARVHLLALGRLCNENVQLRVRDGLESVCLDQWLSPREGSARSGAGRRRSLHAGASSKLLLAFAPTDVRDAFLGTPMPRFTAKTIVHRGKLLQELERIRSADVSISDGETSPAIVAIAAPVRDAQGNVVAALGVSGAAARLNDKLPQYVAAVREHAALASNALREAGEGTTEQDA